MFFQLSTHNMKYYIDSEGYLMSLSPIEGGIEVDAPKLDMPLSQYKLVNNEWILSDVVPQRVINIMNNQKTEASANIVLKRRLAELSSSDWTDTASAPARLGNELYDQWQTYRQDLRDITIQSGYPLNVVWPTKPQG